MQDLPAILKSHHLQSLGKALEFLIEKKIERAIFPSEQSQKNVRWPLITSV